MIVAVIFLNHNGLLSPETIFRYLKEHQIIAPFIFISIYVILTITMLPTLPFNLGAGFLWGAWIGMAYSVIAASIGAILAFLISRHLLSDSLNKRFNHKIWLWLQNEIEKKDWKIVAFTRINPIFPFGLTNYFYGITKIPAPNYILGTILFTIPPSLMVSAIGASINSFVVNGQTKALLGNISMIGLGVVVLVSLKIYFSKNIKEIQIDDDK